MIDGTVKRERPLTIKEERARSSDSACWENFERPPIVRFLMSDFTLPYWVGVPFGSITSSECIEKEDGTFEMGVQWKDNDKVRNIFITGPKVPELFAWFCLQLVSVVRSDGKDITRVALLAPKVDE